MTPLQNCEWLEVHLSPYIDNEIDETSRRDLDQQCVRCEKCRLLVSEHKYLGECIRQRSPNMESSTDILSMYVVILVSRR